MKKVLMGGIIAVMGIFLALGGTAASDKKAKLPKDIKNTRTGKVASDLATGRTTPEKVFDGRQDKIPVEVRQSTTTRTPQQAIIQYKNSGPAPNQSKGLKVKSVPAPPKKK